MKTNELMIDDLVQEWNNDHTETHIVKVEKPMREGVYDKWNHFHDADWIEPIPLTEEILEKNDFQRQEEERGFSEPYIVYVNEDYYYPIKIYPKGLMDKSHHLYVGDYDDDPFISLYINYVHELQHALRLVGLTEMADNLKV